MRSERKYGSVRVSGCLTGEGIFPVLFLAPDAGRIDRKEGGEMNFPNQKKGAARRVREWLGMARTLTVILIFSPVGMGEGRAGDSDPPPPVQVETGTADAAEAALEALWQHATLIRNDPGDPLGSLALTGRLHYDYVHLDADAGEEELWAFRRFRTGFRARLYEHWELNGETEWDLNDSDPLYASLTNAYLAWHPGKEWTFRVGKQAAFFTLEGATSSNELLTMERSNLANNLWFPALFIPGVTGEYAVDAYRFTAGLFSGGSASPEFGNFDGSVFGLLKASRDFAEELEADSAILGLHWVVQDPDRNNTFTRPHEHVTSVNFRYEKGRWGWQGDLARSLGAFEQPDLTGVVLMPYLNLDEQWQLVARATFLESDGAEGIRLARYENRLASGRGDRFEDFYVGLNRYFKGHQLKWQTGLSYTRLDDSTGAGGDYAGWNCSSGIRISW